MPVSEMKRILLSWEIRFFFDLKLESPACLFETNVQTHGFIFGR